MTRYWEISASVETNRDGWTSVRSLPTFYLHSDVQGITNEESARKVALDILTLNGMVTTVGTFHIHVARVV